MGYWAPGGPLRVELPGKVGGVGGIRRKEEEEKQEKEEEEEKSDNPTLKSGEK